MMSLYTPASSSPYSIPRSNAGVYGIAVVSTLIFVGWARSRLVEGHNWGDDFGLYLQLADNIVNGKPYNYLNTLIQVPPGFPILLAGWAKAFGWSFVSMKTLNIAGWVVAAWVSFVLARISLGRIPALYVLLAHFLLPSYYAQQQAVLSDVTFVMFVDVTLLCCFLYLRDLRRNERANLVLFFGAIISLFCTLLIRPAGLPLVLAVAFASILQGLRERTQPIQHAWLAIAVIGMLGAYLLVFGSSASTHTANALTRLTNQGGSLASGLATMVFNRAFDELRNLNVLVAWHPTGPYAAMSAFLAIGFGGIAYLSKTKDLVVPLFAIFYSALLLVTPWNQGFRYLLPLVSVVFVFSAALLLWILDALRAGNMMPWSVRTAATAGALLLVFLGALECRGVWKVKGYNDDEIADVRTKALIEWIRRNTHPADRVCSFKPRAIMFFTARETCYIPENPDIDVVALLESQRSSYAVLITRPAYSEYKMIDERLGYESSVAELFRNADYVVYELRRAK